MEDKQFQQLLGRLDAISRILILTLPENVGPTKLIQVLSESGMAPKDIAAVIGTTPNVVRVTLARKRKTNKKKK